MTKKTVGVILLMMTATILSSFTSCQDKSRQELILGKWRMDEKEYTHAQMALEFKKDKTATTDRIVNGQSTFKQLYNYKLIDNNQYLLLEPIDSNKKMWKVGIVKLDNKSLTFRSQSPDSSLLVLKRQNE
ncbi:MAG: hypothetical protein ABI861_11995 [Panacibacter sp.]